MGLRIFSQLAFGAICMLLGQISIRGETVGHRFLSQLQRAGLWSVDEVRKVQFVRDVLGIKEATVKKVEKAKELGQELRESAAESVDDKIERLRKLEPILAGTFEDSVGRIKKEVFSDDDDEEGEEKAPLPAVSTTDQESMLKNLP